MKGSDVRRAFEAILPDEELLSLSREFRLQVRERKLDAVRFVRAMVIAAGTYYGGRQADVLRLYVESGAERGVRGRFYAWFGGELEL